LVYFYIETTYYCAELAARDSLGLSDRLQGQILDTYRRSAITPARGLVLEIDVGSWLNLSLYGPAVRRIVGLDPSTRLLHMGRKRVAQARVPVSLVRASAADISFADETFDAIAMTWTLCSIPNPIGSAGAVEDLAESYLRPLRAAADRILSDAEP